MGRFQAGWRLGRRSWGLLRRDKEQLWLPALAGLAVVMIMVALGLAQVSAAVGIGVGVVGFLVVEVLSACVSGIARAALYQYATTGGGFNSGGFSGRGL